MSQLQLAPSGFCRFLGCGCSRHSDEEETETPQCPFECPHALNVAADTPMKRRLKLRDTTRETDSMKEVAADTPMKRRLKPVDHTRSRIHRLELQPTLR